MKRKIIQITTAEWGDDVMLLVLCNDGTVWRKTTYGDWLQVDPIPDGDSEEASN